MVNDTAAHGARLSTRAELKLASLAACGREDKTNKMKPQTGVGHTPFLTQAETDSGSSTVMSQSGRNKMWSHLGHFLSNLTTHCLHPADHRENLKHHCRDFWEPNICPLSLSLGRDGGLLPHCLRLKVSNCHQGRQVYLPGCDSLPMQ